MLMRCPRCQVTFENQIECPSCGVALTFKASGKGGDLSTFARSDAFRWRGRLQANGAQASTASPLASTFIAVVAITAAVALSLLYFMHR